MKQRVLGKVGLIGTGMVGSSFAYALTQRNLVNELVLIDKDATRAEGEAMDLSHGMPFMNAMHIYAGEYADLKDADVIVMTAGANQGSGNHTDRLDLLRINLAILQDILPRVLAVNATAQIVIASNPVDLLTTYAADIAGPGRVIGSGTILDTARLRFMLSRHYDADLHSVQAYVIGEHGHSAVPVWSLATVAGVPLASFQSSNGKSYNEDDCGNLFEQTRMAAYEIIQRKRATYYAIGVCLVAIVEAILRDQRRVLTVGSLLDGQYGVNDIALSLPCVVGRNGIEQVLSLPFNAAETTALLDSADTLQRRLAEIQQPHLASALHYETVSALV